MKITVEVKSVYGVDRIYPVCDKAKVFVELIGNKTLSKHNIILIQLLGFEVEVKAATL